MNEAWVENVEKLSKNFAKKHGSLYNKTKRELAASFEIGCFHALINFYDDTDVFTNIYIENLKDEGYRYLTTPSGNPANFSYLRVQRKEYQFEIRQQVRIRSHLHQDIAFTPDIVLIATGAEISGAKMPEYAAGKRTFFSVSSENVIAAHECKSMVPFPELLVSFLGQLITAHSWYETKRFDHPEKFHLSPTLFVGGAPSGLHIKMINAMEHTLPINIIVGLYAGTWDLHSRRNPLNRITTK